MRISVHCGNESIGDLELAAVPRVGEKVEMVFDGNFHEVTAVVHFPELVGPLARAAYVAVILKGRNDN